MAAAIVGVKAVVARAVRMERAIMDFWVFMVISCGTMSWSLARMGLLSTHSRSTSRLTAFSARLMPAETKIAKTKMAKPSRGDCAAGHFRGLARVEKGELN